MVETTEQRGYVQRDIARILLDRHTIAARIEELGDAIRAEIEALPAGVEVVIVPVLTGALIFVADLIRRLPHKIRITVVTASSYAGRATTSSGDPIVSELPDELRDKYVLIVDDILDSGTTIRRIRGLAERHEPRTVRACVLLRKRLPAALATPCEFVGFDIDDEFVVGYGLDYDGYYRNLPDIGVLKQEAL